MTVTSASKVRHALFFWVSPTAALSFLYLLTIARNHAAAEDAVRYILAVNEGFGWRLFHPNHLLYGFLNRIAVEVCRLKRLCNLPRRPERWILVR